MLTAPAPALPAAAPRPGAVAARIPRWADPALLGVAGALVAGWHVWRPAIWRDEAASIGAAERPWHVLGGLVAHVDAVHAVYYAFLHCWFAVVGYTPLTLRLPSVLATGGTAAAVTVLAARLAGRRAGLASGAVAAVLPSLVWAGGEGRSYAFTALLASAATLALVHALGPHRSRAIALLAWAGHAALLALAAAVFLDDVLLAAAHALTALLVGRRLQRLGGIASAAVAGLAVLPLARLAGSQSGQVGWIRRIQPSTPWHQVAVEQWFRADHVADAALVLVVVGVVAAVLRRRLERRALAVLLPWALLPAAVLLAVGLVHDPVYWPRYVTFTAPAVAVLLGLAAAALPRPATVVAVLVIAALAAPQIAADRAPRAKADSEMALAAALMARERHPGDAPAGVVYGQYGDVPGLTTRAEAIAYPTAFRGLVDLRAAAPLADSPVLFGQNRTPAAVVPRMRALRTVWFLLDPGSKPRTTVPIAAMAAIGLHPTGSFRTSRTLLLRFSR